jgi:hypothetical protein
MCLSVISYYSLFIYIYIYIVYLVTLTLYEKIDKDMVMPSIITCSDAHCSISLASLPSDKNINNDTQITPRLKCYIGIICALADFIFISEGYLHILVPAPLVSCWGWQPSLGGVRGVNNALHPASGLSPVRVQRAISSTERVRSHVIGRATMSDQLWDSCCSQSVWPNALVLRGTRHAGRTDRTRAARYSTTDRTRSVKPRPRPITTSDLHSPPFLSTMTYRKSPPST